MGLRISHSADPLLQATLCRVKRAKRDGKAQPRTPHLLRALADRTEAARAKCVRPQYANTVCIRVGVVVKNGKHVVATTRLSIHNPTAYFLFCWFRAFFVSLETHYRDTRIFVDHPIFINKVKSLGQRNPRALFAYDYHVPIMHVTLVSVRYMNAVLLAVPRFYSCKHRLLLAFAAPSPRGWVVAIRKRAWVLGKSSHAAKRCS